MCRREGGERLSPPSHTSPPNQSQIAWQHELQKDAASGTPPPKERSGFPLTINSLTWANMNTLSALNLSKRAKVSRVDGGREPRGAGDAGERATPRRGRREEKHEAGIALKVSTHPAVPLSPGDGPLSGSIAVTSFFLESFSPRNSPVEADRVVPFQSVTNTKTHAHTITRSPGTSAAAQPALRQARARFFQVMTFSRCAELQTCAPPPLPPVLRRLFCAVREVQ